MPTDITLLLTCKAEAEAQAAKEDLTNLTITFLWATLGLVLAMLMFRRGFDATLALTLVVNG